MQRTFSFAGRRYRIDLKQAAWAIFAAAGFAGWSAVIVYLTKAVLLG